MFCRCQAHAAAVSFVLALLAATGPAAAQVPMAAACMRYGGCPTTVGAEEARDGFALRLLTVSLRIDYTKMFLGGFKGLPSGGAQTPEQVQQLSHRLTGDGALRDDPEAQRVFGDGMLLQGRFDDARRRYASVQALIRGKGDPEIDAAVTANLGVLAAAQGRYAEAREQLKLALQRYEAILADPGQALARATPEAGSGGGLAGAGPNLQSTLGNLNALVAANMKTGGAVRLTTAVGLAATLVQTNLANLAGQLGQHAEADGLLQQALDRAERQPGAAGRREVLYEYAVLYRALGKTDEADDDRQRADAVTPLDQITAMLPAGLVALGRERVALAHSQRLHAMQGQAAVAIYYGKRAVNVVQRLRGELGGMDRQARQAYLADKKPSYALLAGLLLRSDRLAEAEQVRRLLKEDEGQQLRQTLVASARGVVPYTTIESQSLARYDALAAQTRALEQQRLALLQTQFGSGGFSDSQAEQEQFFRLMLDNLGKSIDDMELAPSQMGPKIGPVRAIAAEARNPRTAPEQQTLTETAHPGAAPAVADSAPGSPAGGAGTARDADRAVRRRAARRAGFEPLPAVRAELKGMVRDPALRTQGALPGTICLDRNVTAATLRSALREQRNVVHIASHFAFRAGGPTESFLLLGDGSRLSLAEMTGPDFRFDRVDLVTLSACETALSGKYSFGQEVEGLGTPLQGQGAAAVLATRAARAEPRAGAARGATGLHRRRGRWGGCGDSVAGSAPRRLAARCGRCRRRLRQRPAAAVRTPVFLGAVRADGQLAVTG